LRILDLFCGAGGATKGYQRAGFYVVGVDIKPQPHYCGDEFHQADALTYSLDGFDVIHASPPCQHYSTMTHIHKNKNLHPDLIDKVRNLLQITGKIFVIENVIGSKLKTPIMLCGTSFGLRIAKHRLFEINPKLYFLMPPCQHENIYDPYHGGEEARGERTKLAEAIGIDFFMTRPEVREAIPPAYTEWIGKQLIKYFLSNKKNA